jgi:virginiamycin B lyase
LFNVSGSSSIGRITPAGVITLFTDPSIIQPRGIAAGPDGNLWFTNRTSIGRITPAGVVSSFPDSRISGPGGISAGPDGGMWFTNDHSIGRITATNSR